MLPSANGTLEGVLVPPDVVVVDEAGYLRLPGNIALYRAALDLARGDVEGTVSNARQAILVSAPDDDLTRTSAAALSGLASWSTGDLESAYRGYAEGIHGLQRVGWLSDVLGCSVAMADLRRMPPGTLPPIVQKFDASSLPVSLITLKGEGMSETQLRDVGQFAVRNQLAGVPAATLKMRPLAPGAAAAARVAATTLST